MDLIPQETEADKVALGTQLKDLLTFTYPSETRVFLFGSWASYQKSFTEGDVDIFIGTDGYDYEENEELATLAQQSITVETKTGETYPDRRIEIHWGDVDDFLSRLKSGNE